MSSINALFLVVVGQAVFVCAFQSPEGDSGQSTHVAAPVAICISGGPRSFNQQSVYKNIYDTNIAPLGDAADVFVALHNAQEEGKATYQEALQHLKVDPARVVFWKDVDTSLVSMSMSNRSSSFASLGVTANWSGWGKEQAHGFAHCAQMIRQAEDKRGQKYTWVVRLRPDQVYHFRVPSYASWPKVSTPSVWVDYLGGCHGPREVCLDDQVAFLTRDVMDSFFSAVNRAYVEDKSASFLSPHTVDTGADGPCPECVLGAVLSQANVAKKECQECAVSVVRDHESPEIPADLPVIDMAHWSM